MTIYIPEPEETTGDDTELRINRANTLAFIDADPVKLVLTPTAMQRVAGGGRKPLPGTPRSEQKFRLIPQTDVMPQVQTPDGVQLTPTFVLMGAHDAAMERWDTFTFGGVEFQLVSPIRPVHTNNRYESKADVAVR